MEFLWQDVRYSTRSLLRTRGLTALVLLLMVLSSGLTVVVFTFLNAALLRALRFADRIVWSSFWKPTRGAAVTVVAFDRQISSIGNRRTLASRDRLPSPSQRRQSSGVRAELSLSTCASRSRTFSRFSAYDPSSDVRLTQTIWWRCIPRRGNGARVVLPARAPRLARRPRRGVAHGLINPNRKIFEARKRETAALGAGEKLVLGHPLAATIGDSARCMQNLEKVLFTGPKTSDTVTFICD